MPFLPPNQQRQSTEGTNSTMVQIIAILNKYQQARADIKHLILASTATQKGTCAMCIKSKKAKTYSTQ